MLGSLGTHFAQDDIGVWKRSGGAERFGYTDGAWVERYLEDIFRRSKDLSSESEELETFIKDWNTEYHLSRKRKDLLSGLTHDRNAKVLEIGCGCGAITRFLGEQYDSVVAVEGSYSRARLAKLRTADLPNVEVVASRYQDLGLEGTFDIVFCIGVLEYAPTYVDAADPFGHALESMRNMLKPDGTLVIAIENKLGLKYFANSREDHAGTFFEGIEGYPRTADKFETFGRKELSNRLSKYWSNVQFYYPFPDYKMPTMLLSETALDRLNVGEMIASLQERDYAGTKPYYFDNRLAWREIARNGLVGEFANSFLVVASARASIEPSMDKRLGVLFNRDRRAKFSTQTSIQQDGTSVIVNKILANGGTASGPNIRLEPSRSNWLDQETVAYSLFRSAHAPKLELKEQANPVRAWWACIISGSTPSSAGPILSGEMIDAVWHNCCVMPDGTVSFFDQEMVWNATLPAQDLFLRAAYQWIARYGKREMAHLGTPRAVTSIRRLAFVLHLNISRRDIARFARREARLQSEIGTITENKAHIRILAQLYIPYCTEIAAICALISLQSRRAHNLARRVVGK